MLDVTWPLPHSTYSVATTLTKLQLKLQFLNITIIGFHDLVFFVLFTKSVHGTFYLFYPLLKLVVVLVGLKLLCFIIFMWQLLKSHLQCKENE